VGVSEVKGGHKTAEITGLFIMISVPSRGASKIN
jgi:hypothetical protein